MSLKKKFINGLSWQALNVFTQVILQLIFIAVLARLISKEAFGVMAIALVVVGFVEIFSQIGIGPALIQKKDPTKEHISAAFAISVTLGAVFTGLMFLLAPLVADLYDHPPLTKVLRVIGLSFLISSIAIVPKSLIIKEMAFKKLFIAALVAMSIGNICIGIGMAYMGYDLWAYVAALLSQNLIMMVFYWVFKPIKINHKWNWEIAKELVVYGGGSTLFNFFNYAATKIDTLIVGMLSSPSGMSELNFDQNTEVAEGSDRWATTGIYDRSVYLMGLPITVLGKLSDSVMFSGLSMLQDNLKKLQRAVLSAVYHISLLVIPGTVFLLFFTREITVLFLGNKYEAAVPIVNILFISVTFRSLIKIGDAVVRAVKASYLYAASGIKAVFF
ncbi:MAG: lipopolysaccharide biosynthesis protein, partial [Flavobacteriales bacterium]